MLIIYTPRSALRWPASIYTCSCRRSVQPKEGNRQSLTRNSIIVWSISHIGHRFQRHTRFLRFMRLNSINFLCDRISSCQSYCICNQKLICYPAEIMIKYNSFTLNAHPKTSFFIHTYSCRKSVQPQDRKSSVNK